MLIAGLTGNYGMGKSAVLSILGELGALTIDADRIVGRLLQERKVIAQIKKLFGANVFDEEGLLDKKKIADRIFKNKSLRLKLEDILHPLVFERVDEFIKGHKDGKKVFIVEAPLIFERGYEGKFDRTITVYTSETIAINRLSSAGITAAQAQVRLKSQLPIKEKVKRSDFSIDNSGGIGKTRKQVEVIFKKLVEEAKVKELLFEGKAKDVKRVLGRPFFMEGTVVRGAGRGAKILHTPTANIAVDKPAPLKEGVYAVRVAIRTQTKGKKYLGSGLRTPGARTYAGVANIGKNPTFGEMPVSYEVHIFNFSGNLLGKKLRVDFIARIRDEKKFPDAKTLEEQIKRDIRKAKGILRAA